MESAHVSSALPAEIRTYRPCRTFHVLPHSSAVVLAEAQTYSGLTPGTSHQTGETMMQTWQSDQPRAA